jgi:UDP-3-O-[3-hydroxymyristoyl] glucosamine N-acyltransferase
MLKLGENTVIAAQTGVAGSTKLVKRVDWWASWNLTTIGNNVRIQAQSGVGQI